MEWIECTLGDVLNFRRGYDLPHSEMRGGDVPVAGSNGVIGYHDVATSISPVITIGRSGNVGTPFMYEKAWAHNTTLFIDDFKGNDPLYLYYLVKTLPLSSFGGGSAVPTLNRNHIHPLVIKHCSDLNERRRIAGILKSFDDIIALNSRINHNLEEQAQALYKSWFVDFEPFKGGKFVDSELGMIPEGWHIGTLSEIADITMGQSPSGSSFNEDGHGIVFYQGRTEFGFRFPSIKLFTTEPTRFAEPHSVLMSVRAPVGDINMALDRCCIGRGLAAITAKDEAFSFVLYTLKGKSSELDLYNGEGTVFGSINRKDLEGLSVLIPPMSIIQQFNDCIRPIDESIEIACKEIVNLSFSRDSLLPRLMSGQLSFDECDC